MSQSRRRSAFAAASLVVASTVVWMGAASADPPEINHVPHVLPIRGGSQPDHRPEAPPSAAAPVRGNGIDYHGGPVMTAPVTAHIIWYGDWASGTGPAKQAILTHFLANIGGSPYYRINTTYTDGSRRPVPNSVTLGSQTTDTGSGPGSPGITNLSDAAIQTIVSQALSANALSSSADAVYFVLTAPNVTKQGFLTSYCGWHTHAAIGGRDIKYSFVGDPTGPSMSSCAAQTTGSPNNNPAADAMATVIAHELEETATDPDLNAWYDRRGYENADKCAWTFGTTSAAGTGTANMTLPGKSYLVQRNWVNAGGGYCALSYP